MKTSIKRRVAFTFMGLMIAALLAIGIINQVFSGDFYLREKQRKLKKSWEMFNEEIIFIDDDADDEDGDADNTDQDSSGSNHHFHDEIKAEEVEDDDPDTSEDDSMPVISEDLEHFCQVNALTYAVVDYNLNFRLTNAKDGYSMASRLFGNIFNIEGVVNTHV